MIEQKKQRKANKKNQTLESHFSFSWVWPKAILEMRGMKNRKFPI